jgi:hypothetical protein
MAKRRWPHVRLRSAPLDGLSSFSANTYTSGTRMDSGQKPCGVHEVTTGTARRRHSQPAKKPQVAGVGAHGELTHGRLERPGGSLVPVGWAQD